MRKIAAAITGLTMAGFMPGLAAPALASNADIPAIAPPYSVDTSMGTIPAVIPGDHIAVACAALDSSKMGNDVRVVLRFAPEAGEPAAGFEAVIPTDEERMHGSIRFRVPKMQSLVNRTMRLKVYVLGNQGAQTCDGGLVKIV
ncbi:MAG: hypothetical protein J0I26_03575 [Alphaproteobacteria bacterium]|jgi:hypothetical protein|nr:hypothetical protein [Alphaproteobacteria bacterium]OJU56784.1 MAG: hypothetical protein BGO00_04030 [Alphaproteobacteria bacterium 62-8]MBN9556589.1 hypothetical protein [Alphaproteobacteria bacterium]MBN9568405.1 hypothetical protein [Alphaproteobacteria bacterium]MBN9578388.1 hypothetical protein [Alphaproteobacteria bacterium]